MNRARRLVFAIIGLSASLGSVDRAYAQGYPPEGAAARMTVPEGLGVQLFAAEPLVRQPVAMTFDERGRLWVIQYLQYPNPAGLKRVSVDRYSRTEYDRIPESPPKGPRGADRITILEDTNGDGRADRAKDFIEGLNLASGMLHGHGGLYVLQTPYLLFYPDHNRDDVPDGDPEVLLTGFGMQDAHAVANSLAWGPDGWLYGAQGSTVTANIRGISFQQGIWRYHPTTRRFELFAEGGGNTWGLDFDRHGNLLAGTNVGPYAMLHQVQGGYYWKSFGKHGELHNPYAFGYLDHVPYTDFRGGHVTCGGIVYQGDSFPERFRDRYLAANLLSHAVHWHELTPRGSTFAARHGGELLVAGDTWFAPVDLAMAPDGSVFVADWHDQRTAHPDPDADWDRRNGRIYRIQAAGAKSSPTIDLAQLKTAELVDLLDSPSGWHRAVARRLLIERNDPAALAPLRARLTSKTGGARLEAFWTLYSLSALSEDDLIDRLADGDEYVRTWAVRYLGDAAQPSSRAGRQLALLAKAEPSAVVRSQLASTTQRLSPALALPIIAELAHHDADADDLQIPLLLWWALERQAPHYDAVFAQLKEHELWNRRLFREHLLNRLARRWIASGNENDRASAARLLTLAPSSADREPIIAGLNSGLTGQHFDAPPPALLQPFEPVWSKQPRDLPVLELGLRLGMPDARAQAHALIADRAAGVEERTTVIKLLGECSPQQSTEHFLTLFESNDEAAPVRLAALTALGNSDNPAIAKTLLAHYDTLPPNIRVRVLDVLASRRPTAKLLVDALAKSAPPAADISADQLRQLASHNDAALDAQITRLWGKVRAATPEERLAVVRRLNNDLRAGSGDPVRGQVLFREHCGKCHQLFGEGNQVGPELTTANRADRDFLLVSLVDPNSQIRKEYLSHVVQTDDGRVLTGLVVEDAASALTLLDATNQRHTINKSQIEALEPSAASLMPEGLLEKLSPGQLRDLFSYLQSPQALPRDKSASVSASN